tara:strand:- start:8616 stop:9011 length:396 start_codon:yes stop_codon:yes gene_type:complete
MSIQLTMAAGEAEDVMYILEDYISDKEALLNDSESWFNGSLDAETVEIERANLATAILFHARLVDLWRASLGERVSDLLGLTEESDKSDGTAPCDKCGVAVRERDFCGDDGEYLCPDCYDTDETPTNQQGG